MKRPVTEHLEIQVVKLTEYLNTLDKGSKEYSIGVRNLAELNKALCAARQEEANEQKLKADAELGQLKLKEESWQATTKHALDRERFEAETTQHQEQLDFDYAKLEQEERRANLDRQERIEARKEEAKFRAAQLKQQHEEFMFGQIAGISMDLLDRGLEREYYNATINYETTGIWSLKTGQDIRKNLSFLKKRLRRR